MCQALINLNISHEELKTIMNEKERYDQMKENTRNTKSRDELSEIIKKIVKMHRLKKYIFFVLCI